MENDVFRWYGRELRVGHKSKARAGEPAARGNISLARHALLSQFFKISFARQVPLYCEEHVFIYTSDCVQTVYGSLLLPNNSAMKHIYTNRSGAKCWLVIYHWGAGLAVTGRIYDIGQNVIQYSFVTGSSSSPTYFLIAFMEEAIVINII
jgi:hypothetical protein